VNGNYSLAHYTLYSRWKSLGGVTEMINNNLLSTSYRLIMF